MNAIPLDTVVMTLGELPITLADLALAGGGFLALVIVCLLFAIWRGALQRRRDDHLMRTQDQQRIAELLQTQNALSGRLAAMQETMTTSQSQLSQQVSERLDSVTGRVNQSLAETTKSTQENLAKLQERLAVIDTAQNNIQSLAQNVVGLQAILQDKQTRGAFGQSRMEAIVRDGLPMGAYEFQATLSNRSRPDCLVRMPNDAPSLVIDAKFPLEAWNALRAAEDDPSLKDAARRFRRDMEVHLKDISEKYLLTGETQETAFLFVPSESIFAEIHENFEGVVQRAHKARVVIVSPSLLLLSIQVIQAILKDARMREQAHLIQAEIAKFSEDLSRLDDRVRKLKGHFDMTGKDIDQILTSTGKLTRHGERIGALEFGAAQVEADPKGEAGKPFLRAIEGGD